MPNGISNLPNNPELIRLLNMDKIDSPNTKGHTAANAVGSQYDWKNFTEGLTDQASESFFSRLPKNSQLNRAPIATLSVDSNNVFRLPGDSMMSHADKASANSAVDQTTFNEATSSQNATRFNATHHDGSINRLPPDSLMTRAFAWH